MPKGPKGQKRPADVIGTAVKVAQIATGESEEDIEKSGKSKAAQELGRLGGKARAAKMSAYRRREIARKAAEIRWAAEHRERGLQ
ncbi:MAG: RNA-binding protein [Alphaproteobacteria bacterium]|nr:MAG: RNA-binding protein [Alphaproteobacteria bacterium]